MDNKKNTKFIVIIVILVILLLGSVGYIVYDNFIKEDEVVDNNNQDNNNDNNDNQDTEQNNEEENELSEDELNNIGETLFNKTNTLLTSFSGDYMLYQEKDITYNDLENKDRLEYIYLQIPDSKKTYNPNDAYDSSCIDTENYRYTCYYEKVSINTFEEYYHSMFGLDKSINYEQFILATDNFLRCEKEEDEIVCYPTNGGGITDYRTYLNYNHAEEDNGDILVYVKLLVIGYNGAQGGIFSDAAVSNKIADESESVTSDNIFDIYGDEAGLYKLTFKKDTNDNYYWYSSEIVK